MRTIIQILWPGEKTRTYTLPGAVRDEKIAEWMYDKIRDTRGFMTHTVRIVATGPTRGELTVVHQGQTVARGRIRHEHSEPD